MSLANLHIHIEHMKKLNYPYLPLDGLSNEHRLKRGVDDTNPINTSSSTQRTSEPLQHQPSTTGLAEKLKGTSNQLLANERIALALSEKVQSPMTAIFIAAKNTQDTVAVLQTANASLGDMTSILQRMREVADQAMNGGLSDEATKEFQALKDEVTRIGDTANYNGFKLLDGSLELVTKTGTNGAKTQTIAIGDMRAEALGIQGASITSADEAKTALAQVDQALSTVSNQRVTIYKENNSLGESYEKSLPIEQSAIGDSDAASQTAALIRAQLLQNAAEAMLAQANSLPNQALSLLQ